MIQRLASLGNYIFALAALYFMTGGATNLLTPQYSSEAPLVQALGLGIGVLAALGLALKPASINRILVLYWPVLVLPALAIFSLVWSVESPLTMRRSGSLILTTIFALWLVDRFREQQLFRLVVAACALLCAVCWYYILLVPAVGIHQPNDLVGFEHAGSWRGTFFHKNDFGRAIAFCAVVFAVAGVLYRKWVFWAVLGYAQCFVMIANSQSSQAILLAIVPTAVFLLARWLREKSVGARTMLVAAILPLLVIAYMLSGLIFGAVLESLGKDSTLTGRTDIWMGVINALGANFLVGGGFGAGWELVGDRVVALTAIDVGHAHNGYLDLATDLGVVGLFAVVLFAGNLLQMSIRAQLQAPAHNMASFASAFVVFYFVGNWAGSFLMLHNSIYWVLLVSGFCIMRDFFSPYARPVSAPANTALSVTYR